MIGVIRAQRRVDVHHCEEKPLQSYLNDSKSNFGATPSALRSTSTLGPWRREQDNPPRSGSTLQSPIAVRPFRVVSSN